MPQAVIPDRKTEVVASRLLHEIIEDKTDKMLKVSEVSQHSRVSPVFVYQAIRDGRLKSINFGGTKVRVFESEMLKWWSSLPSGADYAKQRLKNVKGLENA